MSKTIAIVQSSYIPWKGFFDMINMVDEFILYDDVQFTKRDWRSRNAIKTAQGALWLSVPCSVKGRYGQLICDTKISDPSWARRHWKSIAHAYARAPHFEAYREALEESYRGAAEVELLCDVNLLLLTALCRLLGMTTPLLHSRDYPAAGVKTDRLLSICKAVGASKYISGPAAKAYIEEEKFSSAGIALEYMDYGGYPEYPQLHPPFIHAVSVIDLLMNVGSEAPSYMKTFTPAP